MQVLGQVAAATWQVYLVASPYILLGLAAAGLMHVLIPADRIARWLGGQGIGTTLRAALLGVPLPICSCAVVPVTIELSKKGASREASLAFLVSTPETGVDSILLTYGLMGPIMAVVRPVAAFVTSLVAALASMLWRSAGDASPSVETGAEASCCEPAPQNRPKRELQGLAKLRDAARYGFAEMVDEIGFWLVVGLLLTGLITALVPAEFIRSTLGEGPASHLILLLLGVPLYMCASASTPVGAALLFKGVSPGAALVFLLAGPATNASSLVVIARFFGRRFVAIYLSSVVITALVSGWLFDFILNRLGIDIVPTLEAHHVEQTGWINIASAAALGVLLLWSMTRGSWRMATQDVARDVTSWRELLARPAEPHRQDHSPQNQQSPFQHAEGERLVQKERAHRDGDNRDSVGDQ